MKISKKSLKEVYTLIEDAVKASNFNWKKSKATPVLGTLKLQEQAYATYIPGQA